MSMSPIVGGISFKNSIKETALSPQSFCTSAFILKVLPSG